MKSSIQIITSYQDEIDVVISPDRCCPALEAYMVPNETNPVQFFAGMNHLAKERDHYKSRYDNVLKGLNYWKARANEMP